MSVNIIKSKRTEYGVAKIENGYAFTIALAVKKNASINLYDINGNNKISFDISNYKLAGDVYSFVITGLDEVYTANYFQYEYICDGKSIVDPYMRAHSQNRLYGVEKKPTDIDRAIYFDDKFDWEDDSWLNLEYNEIIAYQLHVRGFTKHASSKVKAKGCFAGIIEKIPYFIELGINQLELMPCYEFYEIDSELDNLLENHPKFTTGLTLDENGNTVENKPKNKINYWGYKKASYFVPKYAYSYSKDAVTEFKNMVKALHKAGIEVIMQMFFSKDITSSFVSACLNYWYIEYHVDGFHLMGENIDVYSVLNNPVLSEAKLYVNNIDRNNDLLINAVCKNAADISTDFMYSIRKFLKSDSNTLMGFVNASRNNPTSIHSVNYITCYEGFTLADLVSYEHKHNEANGEDNTDGNDYNCSWNCGVEGKTAKKAIKDFRTRQIKNALCMLLLSQATPMIFMGDERMNSQNGNNNPYCQDNEISWLNWKLNKNSEEIFEFTKELIKLRRNNNILHQKASLKGMDYKSVGCPDISYHQDMAWKTDFNSYLLHIGTMFHGAYGSDVIGEEPESLYIAYNMHWDNHTFGLPRIPGKKWEYVTSTFDEDEKKEYTSNINDSQDEVCVYKRSVLVLKSVKSQDEKVRTSKKSKEKAPKQIIKEEK